MNMGDITNDSKRLCQVYYLVADVLVYTAPIAVITEFNVYSWPRGRSVELAKFHNVS